VSIESPSRSRARERARERRERRRRRAFVWAGRIIALAVIFFAGLAIGRALESAPTSGETETSVRTLLPTTIVPRETVTVTLSSP
jgi:anti-sigma factor RsiW